jgi:hypothetical protein
VDDEVRMSTLERVGARSARALGRATQPKVAFAGAWALGAFLGFITLVLLTRTGTNALTLASIVTVLLGVGVFGAISKTKGGAAALSWYFIGLFCGLLLFLLLAVTNQLGKLDSILSPGASPSPGPVPGPSGSPTAT